MPGGDNEPKTSPRRIRVALRRAEALRMRAGGKTYEEIKDALGYSSRSAAVQDVQRILAITVEEPAAEVRALELLRYDQMLARLDEAQTEVMAVLRREHITVNNGRVITVTDEHGNEKPLIDDDPVLRAVDRLNAIEDRRLRVSAERRKLIGLDAATKLQVISDDDLDREEQRLAAEVAELEQATAGTGPEDPGPAEEAG